MSAEPVSLESARHSRVLISVGMPVYNGAREIEAAIEALLSQTIDEFELIISDNCSQDSTQEICSRYAALDRRVKYFRQETNIGAVKNFLFVLQEAKGHYFMWAAADDTRSKDYLELNSRFLEESPDYVASTSPTPSRSAGPTSLKSRSITACALRHAQSGSAMPTSSK